MSQTSRVIFGVAAIALTLGAIPLAAGRDLAGGVFSRSQVSSAAPAPAKAAPQAPPQPKPAAPRC